MRLPVTLPYPTLPRLASTHLVGHHTRSKNHRKMYPKQISTNVRRQAFIATFFDVEKRAAYDASFARWLADREQKQKKRGSEFDDAQASTARRKTVEVGEEDSLTFRSLKTVFVFKDEYESENFMNAKIHRRKLQYYDNRPGTWLLPQELPDGKTFPPNSVFVYADKKKFAERKEVLYNEDSDEEEGRDGLGNEVWGLAKEAVNLRTKPQKNNYCFHRVHTTRLATSRCLSLPMSALRWQTSWLLRAKTIMPAGLGERSRRGASVQVVVAVPDQPKNSLASQLTLAVAARTSRSVPRNVLFWMPRTDSTCLLKRSPCRKSQGHRSRRPSPISSHSWRWESLAWAMMMRGPSQKVLCSR